VSYMTRISDTIEARDYPRFEARRVRRLSAINLVARGIDIPELRAGRDSRTPTRKAFCAADIAIQTIGRARATSTAVILLCRHHHGSMERP